jgi:hypothetical protein
VLRVGCRAAAILGHQREATGGTPADGELLVKLAASFD